MRAHAFLLHMNNVLNISLFLAQQTPMIAINKGAGLTQVYILLAAAVALGIGGVALAVQRDWGHMPHLFVGVTIAAGALSAMNWIMAGQGAPAITPSNLGCLWMMVS